MRRSNAFLRSIFVIGSSAGMATVIACTGGPAIGEGDLTTSSSGNGSSSGNSSSSGSTGSTLVQDTFSHSCNTDDDCVAVLLNTSTCGFCSSTNAAIAKSNQGTYQAAYNQAHASCPPNNAGGTCAQVYNVTQCNAAKTCQLVACGTRPSVDEHHCTAPDGG